MKEYLPIGSVVLLKGGTKKIMIYGRKQMAVESGKMYDYVACFYPEGNVSDEYTFLFDHNQIDKVIFKGYSDDEDKKFIKEVLNADEAEETNGPA
ncbi:MAG: DUF4176 domain-containing protein [Thermocaproicibacter melissae]|jgi:hypothetical protein|uniref:DUF4176 domain-containing protein n=1 Tax=Thermocaproicibacter melissae TaxID=2966552 RepID=UPI0024B08F01|nr:DUF4176 domain-containing protein [Thermocaproicibacter melissae]WBY63711.1 DUF4176 domain-containing protein [Thermocaproicibacter melissae]